MIDPLCSILSIQQHNLTHCAVYQVYNMQYYKGIPLSTTIWSTLSRGMERERDREREKEREREIERERKREREIEREGEREREKEKEKERKRDRREETIIGDMNYWKGKGLL